MGRAVRIVGTVLVSLAFVVTARAEEPKVGDYYKDQTDLGFQVKMPKGWEVIPPEPDDINTLVKYDPKVNKEIELGPGERMEIAAFVIKFDRRKKEDDAAPKSGIRRVYHNCKDVPDWAKSHVPKGGQMKLDSQKDFVANKVLATEYDFVSPGEPKSSVHLYAAVFKLKPDCDIAIAFVGPGDPKRWMKWSTAVQQMARSFGPIDTKDNAAVAQGDTLRDKKRAELLNKIAGQPGWKLYETAHYFIVTPHPDPKFVEELKMRLEAIHEVYEQDYPAAKADEYRKIGETVKTGDQKSDEEKAQEKALKDFLNEGADPKELASCSVVRVFIDHDAYMSYNAPPGSAGFWSPMAKELVLYDDKAGGGRADTWRVLNHEAFHQYIFYFYGSLAPHSWYNEGTGDYYSGFQLQNQRFKLERFKWRTDEIKQAIREKTFVPLKDFVQFTQGDYYGGKAPIGQNYAQGWSMIYFLRTGKAKSAKGWDNRWDSILGTYLRVLATSGKLDQAVEEAFKDVDWDALQTSWADYTLH